MSAQMGPMDDVKGMMPPLIAARDGFRAAAALFDQISDTVYFVKDRSGRYVSVNQTLVARCGCTSKSDLIGRCPVDIFPDPMGSLIAKQDERVLRTGRGIRSKLELHLYASRREGWCLTWKEPVRDADGDVVGLSGISRDLQRDPGSSTDLAGISCVLDHIHKHCDGPLRVPELADMAGLSTYQLERRIRALFGTTLGQYITRERIGRACEGLRQSMDPISVIALDSGYADQAAFSRQFRQSVGLTPGQYRKLHRP